MSQSVSGLVVSNDGRRLLSVGADGCIFVWALAPSITAAIRTRLAEMAAAGIVTPQSDARQSYHYQRRYLFTVIHFD